MAHTLLNLLSKKIGDRLENVIQRFEQVANLNVYRGLFEA